MSAVTKRRLFEIAVQALTREFFGSAQSGIVFAGFGDAEFRPALHAYAVEHTVLGRPRLFKSRETIIDDANVAAVQAFAQGEAVSTFMEGVDPALRTFMTKTTAELFVGATSAILEKVKESDEDLSTELSEFLRTEMPPLLEGLFRAWTERRQLVWGPVIDIVSVLPKDELAAMAEALVNLTKFRRRVTPQLETVGGPLDVDVVTEAVSE